MTTLPPPPPLQPPRGAWDGGLSLCGIRPGNALPHNRLLCRAAISFLSSPEGARQALVSSFSWQSTIFNCVFVGSLQLLDARGLLLAFLPTARCEFLLLQMGDCSLHPRCPRVVSVGRPAPSAWCVPSSRRASRLRRLLRVSLPQEQLDFLRSSFAATVAPASRSSLARLRRELRRIGASAASILPPGAAKSARRASLHMPSFGYLPANGVAGGILLAWSPPLTGNVLWAELCHARELASLPWLLGGDFNCLLSPADSSSPITSGPSMSVFRSFIDQFGLFDVPLINRAFTWSNNRIPPILRRLDRVFLSPELFSAFPSSSLVLGPRHLSDHAPLLLTLLRGRAGSGRSRFRFELWWLRDESFVSAIPRWWARTVNGRWAAFRLSRKLHCIRKEVIAWKYIFWSGKFSEVAVWDEEILSLQSSDYVSADQSSRLLCLQCLAQKWRIRESIHWQQRSRLGWLAHGDQNSRFFHLAASQRRRQTLLQSMVIGHREFLGDDILPALTVHFQRNNRVFRNTFTSSESVARRVQGDVHFALRLRRRPSSTAG
ncbi:Transposon TX1 uncharacterized protein [Nymphaea thermarum]|nr:Transposon TX1 uncharacterized protein [Nymphaea thermarum]